MFPFLKSTSRTVHHYHENEQEEIQKNTDQQDAESISLTVWRKSLLLSCKGFTVIGPDGNLVYRVDNYSGRPQQIILMDGSGNPIFTICRRKTLGIIDINYWLVYEGEMGNDSNKSSTKSPIFCVRKNISIMKTKPSVLAYVYVGMSEKKYAYVIEGSYNCRSCKILDESRKVVSEIKKKEGLKGGGGVSFGLEVFHLIVEPGIASRFAMAIVLLLDQMFS